MRWAGQQEQLSILKAELSNSQHFLVDHVLAPAPCHLSSLLLHLLQYGSVFHLVGSPKLGTAIQAWSHKPQIGRSNSLLKSLVNTAQEAVDDLYGRDTLLREKKMCVDNYEGKRV